MPSVTNYGFIKFVLYAVNVAINAVRNLCEIYSNA